MFLFALTVFTSAAMMFLVEPMIARMVLPRAGGSPMVWNTCIVFFQAMLLAGYGYAHALAARAPRRGLAIHCLALVAPLAFLPLSIRSGTPASGANPTGWLLTALTGSVAVPFFVLATTTSLFQRWFAETEPRQSPYVLYACSNLGSVLALAAYPILIEPRLSMVEQSRWWSRGYMLFLVCAFGAMAEFWRRRRRPGAQSAQEHSFGDQSACTPWTTRGRWMLLAFVPSSLMLGTTTYLATDVASVPLLWVAPLALYLMTFVAAFSPWGDDFRMGAAGALPLLVPMVAVMLVTRVTVPFPLLMILHLAVFTVVALSCHGELASGRPPTERLTEFYLWIAVGGAAGGLFNSLIAPLLFTSVAEYPIVLTLACALYRPGRRRAALHLSIRDVAMAAIVGSYSAAYMLWIGTVTTRTAPLVLGLGAAAVATFAQRGNPTLFALCIGATLSAGTVARAAEVRSLYRERTYFGVYHVEIDSTGTYRQLFHGTTLHGQQALDGARSAEPLAYYTKTGPFGVAFVGLPHITSASHVGVVGLGTGALAAYARDQQRWSFYEIDPAVYRIASTAAYFTYLSGCATRCDVIIGDARQSLARAESARYDLIVLDAFSSDAIPLHLLTQEALRVYLSRLNADGVLAFHISNRYLALAPVLAKLAESERLTARDWFDGTGVPVGTGQFPSEWMFIGRRESDLGLIAHDPRWKIVKALPSTPLWTDDFTNIWSILKWR
jgi:hypothetical protein